MKMLMSLGWSVTSPLFADLGAVGASQLVRYQVTDAISQCVFTIIHKTNKTLQFDLHSFKAPNILKVG